MRRLTLFLVISLSTAFASADEIISKVAETPSGRTIRRGGIFDPRSGLHIEVDQMAVAGKLGLSSDPKVTQDLKDLQTLTDTAKSALGHLKTFTITKDKADFNKFASDFDTVLPIIVKHEAQLPNVSARINLAVGLNNKYMVVLNTAPELAQILGTQILSQSATIQVQLILSRDSDQSRVPEQSLGVLPGLHDPDLLTNFLNSLDFKSPEQVTPQQLAAALLQKFETDIHTDYAALKTKADAIVAKYTAEGAYLSTTATQDAKTAFQSVASLLSDIRQTWQSLETEISSLTSGAQPDPSSVFASLSQIKSNITTLRADVTKVADTLSGVAIIGSDLTDLGKTLKTDMSSVQSEVSSLGTDVSGDVSDLLSKAEDLLNLTDKLTQIGSTLKPLAKGAVDFANSNQSLEGLPALRSYDQVQIVVFAVKGSDPSVKPTPFGGAYEIYAWKPNRLDSITAIGFAPKPGTNQWQYAPIYGQAFKFTNWRGDFATNKLTPAAGFSVEGLTTGANGSVTFGVGAMITLFDDHVVGGYGYNLAGRGNYWYAGYRFRL